MACKMLLPFLRRGKDEDCLFPSPRRVPAAGTALAPALLPPGAGLGDRSPGCCSGRAAGGQGVQREHLLKSDPPLGRTCYHTCGVPKRKTHESYGKASWFEPIPCSLGSLGQVLSSWSWHCRFQPESTSEVHILKEILGRIVMSLKER